jgi:hypothetical protein
MSTGERVSWFFTLLGAALVAAPFVSEDYQRILGDGAFALMFVGGIVLVAGVVAAFLNLGAAAFVGGILFGTWPLC